MPSNTGACAGRLLSLADIPITAPTTTAAAQTSTVAPYLNAPDAVKESPERVLIAIALIAVAVGGYLLRDKLDGEKQA